MAVRPFSPTIPGVTAPAPWDRDVPDALRAVRTVNDEGDEIPEKERGRHLVTLARKTFEAHDWYYREVVEIQAMKNGAQFGFWNKAQQRFVSVADSADENVIRIPVNLIKPAIDQATAMLTAERPIFGAAAATSEGSDSASAEAADAILEHLWRFHCLGEIYRDTAEGAFSEGTAFVLVEWDKSRGAPQRVLAMDPETGMPTMDVQPQGDLKFTPLQRDQVGFDPAAQHPHGGSYVVIRRRLSRAYLLDAFPDRKEDLRKSSDRERFERAEEFVARYSPATGRADAIGSDDEDSLTVYTFFYSSCRKYPQGMTLYVTEEGAILYEGDNEVYPTEEEIAQGEQWPAIAWPLFTVRGDRRGNSPWGRGRTLDAMPIQKAVNGCFSKAVQHAAMIANAKPYLPKNLDFQWTDKPGEVIRYGRGHNPGSFGYLAPPPMPQEYVTIVNMGRELIENGMGINAASNGGSPTSDASGRLAENLQQRDQTRIAPIKAAMDEVWGGIATLGLFYFRRYADGKRKIQVVGENGATALKYLDRSALAAGTDVLVYNDQSIPRDPTRRMLWLMNFSTMLSGAKDEQQRALLLDLARLRDFKGYLEKQSPHRVKALRFNRMLELGEVPIPSPWDHPLTFRATLEEYLQSEQFSRKVESERMDPQNAGQSPTEEIAGFLWEHYSQQLAMQMGGAPASPGGGPPAPPSMPPSAGVSQPGLATPQAGPIAVPDAIPAMTAPTPA